MQLSTYPRYKMFLHSLLLGFVCSALASTVVAQEPVGEGVERQKVTKEEISLAPAKVDVKPVARDEQIRKRLQSVLDATDWFTDHRFGLRKESSFSRVKWNPLSSRSGPAIWRATPKMS